MQTTHIYLNIDLKDTKNSQINIPPRDFPKDFLINNDNFFCGGYFVGYDCSYTAKELSDFFKKRKFSTLAQKSADFLILFIDKLTNEVFVLTGQSGRFPCYFYFEDWSLQISTDFGSLTKSIKKLSIDLDFLVEDLYSNHDSFLTERTLFKQIKQIPPATLLMAKQNGDFILNPLVDMNDSISKEKRLFPVEFANEIIKLLDKLVDERLRAIGNLPFIAELSSGYDSSLVAAALARKTQLTALSFLYPLSPGINIQNIAEKFGKKHHIDIKFIDASDMFPFSTNIGQKFIQDHFYPMDHGTSQALKISSMIYKMGYRIVFEGFGGDELYQRTDSSTWFKFPLQMEYFLLVSDLKNGLDKIFTDQGLHFLLSRDRFSNRPLFARRIIESALSVNLSYFPVYWETGIWGISPLSDPRMAKLSAYCPLKAEKKDIWKDREDIFLKEQLQQKKYDNNKHVAQYLTNPITKKRILNILENSYLTQMGIIRGDEIIDNLKSGRESIYTGNLTVILLNVIMVEHFLQGIPSHKMSK